MILRLIVACWFVGSAIFFAEVAREHKWVSGERARKIIHILVGLWGAWLPLWLGWRSIELLGYMLLLGVFVSTKLKWFKSIHSVGRTTIGEYLFPLAIVLLAMFFKDKVLFAAGMLQMGLSDGLAAVIGTRYGKKTSFKILGNKKSWHGTATFFVCSVAIMSWAIWESGAFNVQTTFNVLSIKEVWQTVVFAVLCSVPITVLELTGKHGIDNITVPLATAYLLSIN